MNFLSLIFVVKIGFTAILTALPLLVLSPARLAPVFGIETKSPVIYRLYGVAVAALLTGYGFGLASALSGTFPTGPVWMGVVSNLGAAGILAASNARRRVAPAILFFGGIGLALVMAIAAPGKAMAPLF